MSSAPRKIIQLQRGQFNQCAEDAERLLAELVYVRAQQLVRIGLPPDLPTSIVKNMTRDPAQPVITDVNSEYLRRELNYLAEFQKFSRVRGQWEAADCPTDLVNNILSAGNWRHFVPLSAISTSPFLRADLTICSTPGYDPASGVFYAPNATFPPIPENPKKDDAGAALERLYHPFSQFPYASDAGRAAFLSHILTQVARHAIDTRPLYVYSAPSAGFGKSLLCECVALIGGGFGAAKKPYTSVPEEMRKVLLSVLLAGDAMLQLDNVPKGAKVRSPVLCAFITADVWSDRKLGVSESPTLLNRCGVSITGNNITAAGDLARRAIVPRLDLNAETGSGRQFEIPDLKAFVIANRPQLLVDALTVICAYALASDPVSLPPLPSFEAWSRIVRDPVAWLGYGDAVETQELETDDEIGPLRAAFAALADSWAFGDKEFSSADVVKLCTDSRNETLISLIKAAGCKDACDVNCIGWWLRGEKDCVAAGLKLVQLGKTHGTGRWKLIHV